MQVTFFSKLTIRVRVTKASMPTFWYAREIGKEFLVNVVARDDHFSYEVVEPEDGFLHNQRFIQKVDAEVVHANTNQG